MDVAKRILRPLRRGAARRKPRGRDWALREPEPPPCPPGWEIGPPDFVGVGAQKAGTTWWFHLIAAHPDVHQDPGQRPELHFFDRFSHRWPTADDVARYHRLFPRPPGGIAGEKTPEYMADYWVPLMLKEAAPETHVLVMLRDPIERYRSAQTHGIRKDWGQDRNTEMSAFLRGMYGDQLRRLYDTFPAERILVLQYERCAADPAGQLARTYAFLGLKPHVLSDEQLRRERNVSREGKVEIEPRRYDLLRRLYEPDVRGLPALVPDLDLSLWPHFRDAA
jgi:hypothetical protein